MDDKLLEFLKLEKTFSSNGYLLYLVGGTVRDYLLNKKLTDMDAVTDATPNEVKAFLPDADFTFMKMGSIRVKSNDVKFDITTLRKENGYVDSRHPTSIEFVKDIKIDVIRRDFTINAMYMDKDLHVYDLVNGQVDLANKVIKMVGDPDIRLKEDPLRIVRAIRFALTLDFNLDKELEKSMLRNKNLLSLLNKNKLLEDLKKIPTCDKNRKIELFNKFDITKVIECDRL